jgi:hypothetical protein
MTYNERIERRNAANYAGRLLSGHVADPSIERCHQCGDLLHPFPEPEYWMQYPMPECCIVDGLKFCESFRKSECSDAYLEAHPTPAAPAKVRKNGRKVEATVGEKMDRHEAAAAVAVSLPDDRDALLASAAAAVADLHQAVIEVDGGKAALASLRYDAVVWKLNGGTHFACNADEKSAGRVVERHCRALPGTVPMWGQRGDFLVTVDGVRCRVEFGDGFGPGTSCHYAFHVVDLDGPFFSETGYRSHFDSAQSGQTVEAAASAIVAAFLKKQRRFLGADARQRLAKEAVPAWLGSLAVPPRRSAASVAALAKPAPVPAGFELVDVVLSARQAFIVRKWAQAAKRMLEEARQDAPGGASSVEVAPSASSEPAAFRPGQRCQVVSTHHPCFQDTVGKVVIVTRVNPAHRSVWAHDDKPVTYRTSRNGRKVVHSDPRCIETIYGMDALRILA